jgi:ubiquinone biosynthesis protein
MVGTLDGRVRAELGSLLVAVMRSDAARVANALLRLGAATAEVDRAALRADLSALLERYRDVSLGDISLRASRTKPTPIAEPSSAPAATWPR